ncbi:MAG: polymerase delta prime subunit, partial [Pseudomonadota bacterium]
EIKIDQIRALSDFMNISTHRQGLRVVVLYPAHVLNMASSNALLKTLEEPPPSTLFLLVTDSLNRLLPTILSRCRKFGVHAPQPQAALGWLQQQGVADAPGWLAEQGGAPLAALDAAQQGQREELDWFLQQLQQPGAEMALKAADKLQKMPVNQLLACLQRWCYDLFSYKLTGTIRYYPRHARALAALSQRMELNRLLKALKSLNQRRAIIDHPLAPKLLIEDILLDYSALTV